jgi:hypothetical protein
MINSAKATELKHNAEIAAHNVQEKTKELAHQIQGIRALLFSLNTKIIDLHRKSY